MFRCSSGQDTASSPESSDSGIQTDHHNSTSHIDSLLTYSTTSSSGHHGNGFSNNNADEEDVDNDDDNNNNNNRSHSEADVKVRRQSVP